MSDHFVTENRKQAKKGSASSGPPSGETGNGGGGGSSDNIGSRSHEGVEDTAPSPSSDGRGSGSGSGTEVPGPGSGSATEVPAPGPGSGHALQEKTDSTGFVTPPTTPPAGSSDKIPSFEERRGSPGSLGERRPSSNEERLPLFARKPSFLRTNTNGSADSGSGNIKNNSSFEDGAGSGSNDSVKPMYHTPKNSLEKDKPSSKDNMAWALGFTEPVAEAEGEKIPLLPMKKNFAEKDSGEAGCSNGVCSRKEGQQKPTPNNDNGGNANAYAYMSDSNPNNDYCSLDMICCCCSCNSKTYEMASDFTNTKFRDDFISKIFKYKMLQMFVVMMACVNFIMIVVGIKTRAKDKTDAIADMPPHYLAVAIVLTKLSCVLVLLMKFYPFGRKKAGGRIVYAVLTLTLCLVCILTMLALGLIASITISTIVCTLCTSYLLLALMFKNELRFTGRRKNDEFIVSRVDITKKRIFLHTVPVSLSCSLVSILIVFWLANFAAFWATDASEFSVLPNLFSITMMFVFLITVGFSCIVLLFQIHMVRRLIYGCQVPLEQNEELFASFFV